MDLKKISERLHKCKHELNNVIINGGSGAIIDDIHYTSSLSLHGVNDVKITNLKISNNYNYDDAIHLVYCKNINFDNIEILDSENCEFIVSKKSNISGYESIVQNNKINLFKKI